MKNAAKLLEKIRQDTGMDIPEGTVIKRTFAGRRQLQAGAISWFMYHRDHSHLLDYGSCEPVTSLLKAKKLTIIANRTTGTHEIYADQ